MYNANDRLGYAATLHSATQRTGRPQTGHKRVGLKFNHRTFPIAARNFRLKDAASTALATQTEGL